MSQKQEYTYKYPRPALTSDIVVFGYDGRRLQTLLIERGIDPFKGDWALPGGFIKMDETIEQCAARELSEETSISGAYLRQFAVFSDVKRDPRGRVVTVAFLALVSKSDYRVIAGDDAAHVAWFPYDELPPLAFDHGAIIDSALEHLRALVATEPIILKLLDTKFSLSELQRLAEIITGETYDRRNFQRRFTGNDAIIPVGLDSDSPTRPSVLYSISENDSEASYDKAFEENDIKHSEPQKTQRRGLLDLFKF